MDAVTGGEGEGNGSQSDVQRYDRRKEGSTTNSKVMREGKKKEPEGKR